MTNPNKKKTLWAVLAPLLLGIITASLFLAHYLTKKTVSLTILNRTGVDMQGGGIRISSEPKEEEVGPIAANDSTLFIFRNGGSGEYHLSGKLKSGKDFTVSGGHVSEGRHARDAVVLEMRGDSVTGAFR
jgi:hypothetical protein